MRWNTLGFSTLKAMRPEYAQSLGSPCDSGQEPDPSIRGRTAGIEQQAGSQNPRNHEVPWRQGVQHSGTLQPRSHMCTGSQQEQKHVYRQMASEAPKPPLTCEMTAEPHRAKRPIEECRAPENGVTSSQAGIQGKRLRFPSHHQSSPLVKYNIKKIHQFELQKH